MFKKSAYLVVEHVHFSFYDCSNFIIFQSKMDLMLQQKSLSYDAKLDTEQYKKLLW